MPKSPYRVLSLELIDEPENPARSVLDENGLEELAASIREAGVIEPLVVYPTDDGRYRVAAGHRRLLASRRAGLTEVPCIVRADPETRDVVTIHENVDREELNAVDEGHYYMRLYHENGEDLEKVAELVRKPLQYVERRCALAIGDEAVQEALRAGQVTLTVAEELLRIRDPGERSYYLHYAIRGGCSGRQAREWRAQANARTEAKERQAAAGGEEAAAPAPAPHEPEPGSRYLHTAAPHELSSSKDLRECLFCGQTHEEWRMYRKYVCGACADRHLVPAPQEGGPRG